MLIEIESVNSWERAEEYAARIVLLLAEEQVIVSSSPTEEGLASHIIQLVRAITEIDIARSVELESRMDIVVLSLKTV